jgi:hypothetical protein
VVGVAAALAGGIFLGGIVGYVAHATFTEPEVVVPPVEYIEKEITDEDLARLCETLTGDEKVKVMEAQEIVVKLQDELASKEAALAEFKAQEITDAKRRKAAQKKWREMESEIETLRTQLVVAEEERDELRVELKQTLRDLDRQIVQTQKYKAKAIEYKEKSTTNLWSSFQNAAKVEICDRGTRKRHAKCHDSVESALTSTIRQKFTTCVDTYQAVPDLRQLEKGDPMPAFAEKLPDDNKFTKKGWVIVFCDPTLPEAGANDGLDL